MNAGEPGDASEVVFVGCDGIVELQHLEVDLDGGAARLGVVHRRVFAGVEAGFDDRRETVGVVLLLGHGGAVFLGAVELEVGGDGVLGDLFAGVLQGEIAGAQAGFGGADVVLLRVAEDEGLRR